MHTCSIIACTRTGSERVEYAVAGRGVHRNTAALRFGTVESAREHAVRHGYTVTTVQSA